MNLKFQQIKFFFSTNKKLMSNKALKYQLKSIISNLKEDILEKIISHLEQIYAIPIEKLSKEKSYKW
jgi:hypothetical protein